MGAGDGLLASRGTSLAKLGQQLVVVGTRSDGELMVLDGVGSGGEGGLWAIVSSSSRSIRSPRLVGPRAAAVAVLTGATEVLPPLVDLAVRCCHCASRG
ncbi:hypothetical protein ZWY2020_043775 [Hordeum vulgare]|nr:hypothetical protein ZWY2020_043775 [Hordeum vulgare]